MFLDPWRASSRPLDPSRDKRSQEYKMTLFVEDLELKNSPDDLVNQPKSHVASDEEPYQFGDKDFYFPNFEWIVFWVPLACDHII